MDNKVNALVGVIPKFSRDQLGYLGTWLEEFVKKDNGKTKLQTNRYFTPGEGVASYLMQWRGETIGEVKVFNTKEPHFVQLQFFWVISPGEQEERDNNGYSIGRIAVPDFANKACQELKAIFQEVERSGQDWPIQEVEEQPAVPLLPAPKPALPAGKGKSKPGRKPSSYGNLTLKQQQYKKLFETWVELGKKRSQVEIAGDLELDPTKIDYYRAKLNKLGYFF